MDMMRNILFIKAIKLGLGKKLEDFIFHSENTSKNGRWLYDAILMVPILYYRPTSLSLSTFKII